MIQQNLTWHGVGSRRGHHVFTNLLIGKSRFGVGFSFCVVIGGTPVS